MAQSLPQVLLTAALILTTSADESSQRESRLKAIEADVASADAALERARAQPPDWHQADQTVDRLSTIATQKHRAGYAAALEIAQAEPQSELGFDALDWLLRHAPEIYGRPEGVPALELTRRFQAKNPRIGKAIKQVGFLPPYGLRHDEVKPIPAYRPAMDLLEAVQTDNPDRGARGHAAFGLALQAKREFEYAAWKRSPNAETLRIEAVQAFEAVVRNYGDCTFLGSEKSARTLGNRARAELFELNDLQPGKVAPEITGEDIDGNRFKLSDYRGKVVLLVFWASWCGPCMADVPHERELAAKFQGRAFVIVGVDGDEDKAKAARAIAKNQIPWRSFWNGPDGGLGPIAIAWNVHSWPTVYVIDHKGVIRYTTLYGTELDDPLANLVAEADAARGNN